MIAERPGKHTKVSQSARQQFLGAESDATLRTLKVAVVGLGGGGSHVSQQLAHLGVGTLRLFDPQRIELTNLNRLVGGTTEDVRKRRWKTTIAKRVALGVDPRLTILEQRTPWQLSAAHLRDCDAVVGCVDSYTEREQLERQSRRYLIPYFDIGMDVTRLPSGKYTISGQVISSFPGEACLRCFGFLNDSLLAQEAAKYGDAGPRPQVVWTNGVLASIAVGAVVQRFLPWSERGTYSTSYLEYDGDTGSVLPSNRLAYLPPACTHFVRTGDLGDPWFSLSKANHK